MHQRSAIELGLLLGLFILAGAPARAQVTDMRVQVNGMACPFCTRGVQKKLKELDGVQEVNVGLKEGNAALILEEGKAPTIHELKEAVKDAGFTLGEVRLTAVGYLQVEKERISLQVRGMGRTFRLLGKGAGGEGPMSKEARLKLESLAAQVALVAVTGKASSRPESPSGLTVTEVSRVHFLHLTVEGMRCGDCVERIGSILKKADAAIFRVVVNLERKEVLIESAGRVPATAALVSKLEEEGFPASVKPEARQG